MYIHLILKIIPECDKAEGEVLRLDQGEVLRLDRGEVLRLDRAELMYLKLNLHLSDLLLVFPVGKIVVCS